MLEQKFHIDPVNAVITFNVAVREKALDPISDVAQVTVTIPAISFAKLTLKEVLHRALLEQGVKGVQGKIEPTGKEGIVHVMTVLVPESEDGPAPEPVNLEDES